MQASFDLITYVHHSHSLHPPHNHIIFIIIIKSHHLQLTTKECLYNHFSYTALCPYTDINKNSIWWNKAITMYLNTKSSYEQTSLKREKFSPERMLLYSTYAPMKRMSKNIFSTRILYVLETLNRRLFHEIHREVLNQNIHRLWEKSFINRDLFSVLSRMIRLPHACEQKLKRILSSIRIFYLTEILSW